MAPFACSRSSSSHKPSREDARTLAGGWVPVLFIYGPVYEVSTHCVLHTASARLIEQQHGYHWWAGETVRTHVAVWSRAVPYRRIRHLRWNCQLRDSQELSLEACAQHESRLRVFAVVPHNFDSSAWFGQIPHGANHPISQPRSTRSSPRPKGSATLQMPAERLSSTPLPLRAIYENPDVKCEPICATMVRTNGSREKSSTSVTGGGWRSG